MVIAFVKVRMIIKFKMDMRKHRGVVEKQRNVFRDSLVFSTGCLDP